MTDTTAGFTGTIPDFLDYLDERLEYGTVQIGPVGPHPQFPQTQARQIVLTTGGWSEDEVLLERVQSSLFRTLFWASSHAGGKFVYYVNSEWYDAPEEHQWLGPADNDALIVRAPWARSVRILRSAADDVRVWLPHGADLLLGDDNELIVQPLEN